MDAAQLIREWRQGLSDNRIRVAQSITVVAQMPIVLLVNAASAVIVALMLSQAQSPLKKMIVVSVLYLILCPMLISWRRLRNRAVPENVSRRRINSLIFYSGFLGIAWSIGLLRFGLHGIERETSDAGIGHA